MYIKGLTYALPTRYLSHVTGQLETTQRAERIEWIDILKGIAIILVVMGHMRYEPGCIALKNGIYSFHMPLFMLLAGFTAALSMGHSASVGNFLYKRFIGIFIPYLVWSFMISPFASLESCRAYSFHDCLNSFLTGNVACWFLPCLLMLQLLFALYTVVAARMKSPVGRCCFILLLFVAVTACHKTWGNCHSGVLDKWDLNFLTSAYRYYIPFGIGVALFQYPRFKDFCTGPAVCTLCVLVVLLLTGVRCDLPLMFSTHLRTVIGVAASLLLIRMFSGKLLPDWANGQLKAIGKDTLIIYLISGVFLPHTCTWFHGMDGTVAFLVYLPICVAVCYICMAIARMISTSPWLSLLMLGKPLRKRASSGN